MLLRITFIDDLSIKITINPHKAYSCNLGNTGNEVLKQYVLVQSSTCVSIKHFSKVLRHLYVIIMRHISQNQPISDWSYRVNQVPTFRTEY